VAIPAWRPWRPDGGARQRDGNKIDYSWNLAQNVTRQINATKYYPTRAEQGLMFKATRFNIMKVTIFIEAYCNALLLQKRVTH